MDPISITTANIYSPLHDGVATSSPELVLRTYKLGIFICRFICFFFFSFILLFAHFAFNLIICAFFIIFKHVFLGGLNLNELGFDVELRDTDYQCMINNIANDLNNETF